MQPAGTQALPGEKFRCSLLLSTRFFFTAGLGGIGTARLPSPKRFDEGGIPRVPFSLHIFDFLRLCGGEIIRFTNIIGEIVEFCGRNTRGTEINVVVIAHQFPVAHAQGHLLAEAPVEGVVGSAGFFASEKWQ